VYLSEHILDLDYRKKQTRTLRISENKTFTNDDVMNYVIEALTGNCPGSPYLLIQPGQRHTMKCEGDVFSNATSCSNRARFTHVCEEVGQAVLAAVTTTLSQTRCLLAA